MSRTTEEMADRSELESNFTTEACRKFGASGGAVIGARWGPQTQSGQPSEQSSAPPLVAGQVSQSNVVAGEGAATMASDATKRTASASRRIMLKW